MRYITVGDSCGCAGTRCITKGDPRDGIIKLSDAGRILCHLEVILGLQAFEQVCMALEDVAQGARKVHIIDLVEAHMEVVI